MNILYIMRYWPVYGGGETITVTLSNEFVKRGHNVFIAYTYYNTIDPMPYSLADKIKSKKLYTIEGYKKNDIDQLRKYIIDNDIDIMINQWGNTTLCDLARKGTKCKLITCWHLSVLLPLGDEMNWKRRLTQPILGKKFFERRWHNNQMANHLNNYRRSDKYVFLAKSFMDEYQAISGIEDKANKFYAINNPLTYHYEYDMENFEQKKKEVLYVGRIFEYQKRVSYVLKIWKIIESNCEFSDWNLKIVGDGPDMEVSKRLACQLGLRQVTFEGFKDPKPYYLDASIFFMTSAMEGFGMTLVEAQQYGVVPVVMDTYSSLHEIIESGKNGIIIPDNDLDGYAKAVEKLMLEPEYRKQLAENALKTCKKFTVEHIAEEWENLFNQMKK
ncbi:MULTISPECIES: glycosyltransferase [Segatella]|uniref:Glycosyl transferase n=2 Tax=Segatella TaxID=2974251 RepID=A0AA37I458_SEGBR|nr:MULTISPECIES: glycosyltransferase [Segatella]UKK79698.1 glycosyltransferase [Segatella baroniae B14]GJG28791.1 glycosyl transferase [Segatella bryantii]SEQ67960.1 Glycosyltransferase involved in cell wall bisynthesis [Segatella baroniae B14]